VSGTENGDEHREFAAAGGACPLYCFVPWIRRPASARDVFAHNCPVWSGRNAVLANDTPALKAATVRAAALKQCNAEERRSQFMQDSHSADDQYQNLKQIG
jgi:hypothetical protein